MDKQILLNKNKSTNSSNCDEIIYFKLDKNCKLLPYNNIINNINLLDVYNNERQESNKIRLTLQINNLCTNILFNNKTEIVKEEGSSNVKCLTFNDKGIQIKNAINKGSSSFEWNQIEAIRDTQISNSACGYDYHCGIDIFNNHLIRSKTFKASIEDKTGKDIYSKQFNTLLDYLRDSDGYVISGYNSFNESIMLHLYLRDETYSFKDAVSNILLEKNGWFGFTNYQNLKTLKEYKNDKEDIDLEMQYDFSRPINNKKSCEFIEMYPDSSLFSFNPKYNSYKNRMEYNWNYCLTYPSSSTTNGFNFINENLNSLEILYFIEKNDNIRFYTISKHNLNIGDTINIYNDKTNLKIFSNAIVTSIGNDNDEFKDYIFNINSNNSVITTKWHKFSSIEYNNNIVNISGNNYTLRENKKTIYDDNNINYYIVDNLVMLDNDFKNLSFKKTLNGEEVKYYVRIFSRIPNWKYSDKEVNEYNIYDNTETKNLLKSGQINSNTFECHTTSMAFSKNIYNDDITQIIYTDDIDLSYLHDNLGRPLTDIYITILKNNAGYKSWYGKDGSEIDLSNNSIEYSHCFGKLNCAFELSKQSMIQDSYKNVLLLNNVEKLTNSKDICNPYYGYDVGIINGIDSTDEIEFNDNQINYYGDLCEYSHINANEVSIQMIGFRFNTAQREINSTDSTFDYLNTLTYEDIITDDYDYNGFYSQNTTLKNVCQKREGYYYYPHYKIPINTLSNNISTGFPLMVKIKKIFNISDNIYKILTMYNHNLENNDKFVIFDSYQSKYYNCAVTSNGILNDRIIIATINDINLSEINDISNLHILNIKPSNIPKYAKLLEDGTSRYIWRDIIHNGFDNASTIEQYPFANGGLYVNSNINLYLFRQNPNNIQKRYTIDGSSLNANIYPTSISGKTLSVTDENNYFNESGITC